ncbi:MAG: DUF192 domain-containing protein [Anaerolineaceae bacterium]|nr:DUF192 domain-containing protein [Anaerolineaceae bacterium]
MQQIIVHNQTAPLSTALRVGYANSFISRLRGLMFTRQLPRDAGLLLVQDRENRVEAAIHMFFVGYNLGTVWLNTAGEVVDRCLARAWRPFYMPSRPALYTLEIHPDRLSEFKPGDQVLFEHAPD